MHSVVNILNNNVNLFKPTKRDQRQTYLYNNQCAQIMLKILISFYVVDVHNSNQQNPNIAEFLLTNQSAKVIFGEKRLKKFSKSHIHFQLSKFQFSQFIQQLYKSFKPTDSLQDRHSHFNSLTQSLNLPYQVCILAKYILQSYQAFTDTLTEVINGIFFHFLAWNFMIFLRIIYSLEDFSYDYLLRIFQGNHDLKENSSRKIKFDLFYKSFKSPRLFARFLNDSLSQEKHNVFEMIRNHDMLNYFHFQ